MVLEIPFDTEFEYTINMSGRSLFPRLYQYDDNGLFHKKKDHFFGQKISKILCLAFDLICIYYMSSDY